MVIFFFSIRRAAAAARHVRPTAPKSIFLGRPAAPPGPGRRRRHESPPPRASPRASAARCRFPGRASARRAGLSFLSSLSHSGIIADSMGACWPLCQHLSHLSDPQPMLASVGPHGVCVGCGGCSAALRPGRYVTYTPVPSRNCKAAASAKKVSQIIDGHDWSGAHSGTAPGRPATADFAAAADSEAAAAAAVAGLNTGLGQRRWRSRWQASTQRPRHREGGEKG
jgi:hypothetical protein